MDFFQSGLMSGKKGIVLGVSNERSIGWGCVGALTANGAVVGLTYENEQIEKKVRRKLAPEMGIEALIECNVASDDSIQRACAYFAEQFGEIDFVIHSIAHAPPEDIRAGVIGCSADGFDKAMKVSVYSFIALCRHVSPFLAKNASILTMSYLGGNRVCPGYNILGVAKASLESSVRYLAYEMGSQGTRVNAISAGPVRTLSGMALPSFSNMFERRAKDSPLKGNTDIQKVGEASLYLLSPLSRGVTGEVHYVDEGYNIMGTFE